MTDDVDPGPEGDLVLLQRAVDLDRVAAGLRRRIRGLTVAGAIASLGWVNPLTLPILLLGDGALLWSTRRLQRTGQWQAAVATYGLGLVVVGAAGGSALPTLFTGLFVAYLVGVVGFAALTAGYLRVLRGRSAVVRAFGLRQEVAMRQRRRSEAARAASGTRQVDRPAPGAEPGEQDVEMGWPSASMPPPLPAPAPWDQPGLTDPTQALPGGFAASVPPAATRRPALDPDGLRPGFHGWQREEQLGTSESGSGDERPADGSDPSVEG